jgi:hypothetical protein
MKLILKSLFISKGETNSVVMKLLTRYRYSNQIKKLKRANKSKGRKKLHRFGKPEGK